MTNITRLAMDFVSHESGQDMIEYALLAAVIALGCVTVIRPLAEEVNNFFTAITAALTTAA